MPTDPQANVYSAVLHYLKAVKAAGTTDTKTVLAKMKETPVNDFFTNGARVRPCSRAPDARHLLRSQGAGPDEEPDGHADAGQESAGGGSLHSRRSERLQAVEEIA